MKEAKYLFKDTVECVSNHCFFDFKGHNRMCLCVCVRVHLCTEDPNLGLHAYIASTLHTEPSPQSYLKKKKQLRFIYFIGKKRGSV